jgi:hypothetical protein
MLTLSVHPLTAALIWMGILFIITFSFFSIVFIIHRRLLQSQYQLEERFNQVAQFLAANKFKYLEVLSKSNIQLKKLMSQINEGKELFKKQLEIVRQKTMSLVMINARYQYLRGYQLTKEIRNDFKKCDAMVDNLRNVSISATQYSKDIANLLVEYREITDNVNHFYEFNLALRYSNEVFKNMYESVKNTITQATEFTIKFDNDKLLTILHDLNQKVNIFYKIVLQLYTFDRILMYLISLRKRIESALTAASKVLSSADYSAIETTYANGSSNITLLEQNLKSINFSTAKNNAIIAAKQLTDALTKIEMGDHTNVLIQKDMNALKSQIAILNKEFGNLNVSFNNIQRYFGVVRDSSVINKITNLNADIRTIVLSFQNLESEFSNYKLIQRAEFLTKIKELSERIIEWKIKLFDLDEEIQTKYKNAIFINDELADIKLTLIQLLGLKLQFNDVDKKGVDTIKNIIEHIKLLQMQLSENYFHNYTNVSNELSKIREQTSLLISSATYNQGLKIYAQRLIHYVNKYRNEHDEINKSLTIAENLYQKGQYQNTIDQMIETATIILTSAKESKIRLN